MSTGFMILTVLFIIVSAVMILIVLVQRPQGGGLAGAFGGAGGGGTDTVFGGRVGDALTVMTVIAFTAYLLLAIGLNVMDNNRMAVTPAANVGPASPGTPATPGATPIDGSAAPTNVPRGGFTPTGQSGQPAEATGNSETTDLPPGVFDDAEAPSDSGAGAEDASSPQR